MAKAQSPKKNTIKMLETIYESVDHSSALLEYEVDENVFSLSVKRRLSLEEMVMFIDDVVSECIGEDYYLPEMIGFLILRNKLSFYAGLKMPKDPTRQHRLLYGLPNDFHEMIDRQIDQSQLDEIKFGIDERIKHQQKKWAAGLHHEISQIISHYESIVKLLSQTFDGVNLNALIESATKIAGFSEAEIAHAVLDYQNEKKAANVSTDPN